MKIIRLGDRYFDLHAPAECRRMSSTALYSFLSLMGAWEVTDGEARILLGRLTSEAYSLLRAAPAAQVLDANRLKRIASLLSIQRELSLLYGPSVANEWVQLPNSHPMFCRVKPLTYMLLGGVQAMSNVQRLLGQRRRAAQQTVGEGVSSPQQLPPQD